MRYGYHVRSAKDGETALGVLANEEIDLVLLDPMLPRMDGFAVLRLIRERSGGTPPYVIVVSAGASTKDRNLVLGLGANEYMAKPFHLIRLLEAYPERRKVSCSIDLSNSASDFHAARRSVLLANSRRSIQRPSQQSLCHLGRLVPASFRICSKGARAVVSEGAAQ